MQSDSRILYTTRQRVTDFPKSVGFQCVARRAAPPGRAGDLTLECQPLTKLDNLMLDPLYHTHVFWPSVRFSPQDRSHCDAHILYIQIQTHILINQINNLSDRLVKLKLSPGDFVVRKDKNRDLNEYGCIVRADNKERLIDLIWDSGKNENVSTFDIEGIDVKNN